MKRTFCILTVAEICFFDLLRFGSYDQKQFPLGYFACDSGKTGLYLRSICAQSVPAWGQVSCIPLCGAHSAGKTALNVSLIFIILSFSSFGLRSKNGFLVEALTGIAYTDLHPGNHSNCCAASPAENITRVSHTQIGCRGTSRTDSYTYIDRIHGTRHTFRASRTSGVTTMAAIQSLAPARAYLL